MYWRVRTVTPEQLLRQYGVHIGLIVSILANVLLLVTRPDPKKNVDKATKTNFEQFARTVTNHILDNSYVSWEQSTRNLLGGELAPSVVTQFQQQGLLPKSTDEIKATARTLQEKGQLTAVRIDSINLADPDASQLIPVTVSGVVAKYSADESGPGGAQPFTFRYLMGNHAKTQLPIVAKFTGG